MGRTAEGRSELVELADDSASSTNAFMLYHPALPTRSKVTDWETKRSSMPMPRTWRGSGRGNGYARLPLA